MAWSDALAALVIAESTAGSTELLALTPTETEIGRASVAPMDAASLVVDPTDSQVEFLAGGRLHSSAGDVLRGRAGRVQGRAGDRVPVADARGATYGEGGELILLSRGALVRVDDGRVASRERIAVPENHDLRGLARDPQTGRLYTFDATAGDVLALDEHGALVMRYDTADLELTDVRGLAFAPTADTTDHASAQSLYLADAGAPATSGSVVETSLDTTALVVTANVEPASVRTVATSAYNPPSPDPSGVTYLPGADRLLIVDGEVEEMSIYQGVNIWATNRAGTPVDTGTALPWSDEPTGVGYNPANNHLFVSDDSERAIFEVAAGSDARFGTADDVVTSLDTEDFGGGDPEGVAYDGRTNSVWIVDGVNREVYRVRPGGDGRFGTSDDVVSQFDIARLGAGDPEGIDYDAVRDTLVVIDSTSKKIYEIDRNGALLNTIDIGPVNMRLAAGVTVGPSTTVAGARSYYAVDRGVDNDSDPRENDGRLYELSVSLPPTGYDPGVNQPPLVSAGPDQTVALPSSASLAGTVSDDGLPLDPGGVTATWGKVSGPGAVTFADAGAVDTTASFSDPGTYVLRLSASDGALTTSDEVTVTVQTSVCAPAAGAVQAVSAAVSAGSDDAEQRVSGSMDLSSSDLELVVDGSQVQVVGLRFPGLAVPAGATVTNAYVQFRTDEVSTGPAALTVRAEATNNAPAYTTASGSVTSRPTSAVSVAWSPPAWNVVGEAGAAQRTSNLCALVQSVVGRPGWSTGNALALQVSGTGTRTAEAFEGMPSAAPRLHVEYVIGGGGGPVNQAPAVSAGSDRSVVLPGAASLDGTVTDDGLPNPPGAVTTTWSRVSGPGSVTFADAGAVDTTASFASAGTYVLRLSAYDGSLTTSDEVTVTVTSPTAVNQAPAVSAGSDQPVTLPGSAALDGTVTDDGLPNPPGAVTTSWSRVSGPGSVTFGNAGAVDTSASFSVAGTYVLRLSASDGALTTADDVTVTVQAAPSSVCAPVSGPVQSVSAAVSAGSDDGEQRVSGSMDLSSSDLELVVDGSREQVVGLRFPGLAVPAGATVTNAYVQFQTDEVSTGAAALTVRAEATNNALAYTTTSGSVTSRATTTLTVGWSPPAWTVVGEAGAGQRTPNLCALVQAVVSRPGWAAGNALALQVVGTGTRTAEAYEGVPSAAPRLHIEYLTGG